MWAWIKKTFCRIFGIETEEDRQLIAKERAERHQAELEAIEDARMRHYEDLARRADELRVPRPVCAPSHSSEGSSAHQTTPRFVARNYPGRVEFVSEEPIIDPVPAMMVAAAMSQRTYLNGGMISDYPDVPPTEQSIPEPVPSPFNGGSIDNTASEAPTFNHNESPSFESPSVESHFDSSPSYDSGSSSSSYDSGSSSFDSGSSFDSSSSGSSFDSGF